MKYKKSEIKVILSYADALETFRIRQPEEVYGLFERIREGETEVNEIEDPSTLLALGVALNHIFKFNTNRILRICKRISSA